MIFFEDEKEVPVSPPPIEESKQPDHSILVDKPIVVGGKTAPKKKGIKNFFWSIWIQLHAIGKEFIRVQWLKGRELGISFVILIVFIGVLVAILYGIDMAVGAIGIS